MVRLRQAAGCGATTVQKLEESARQIAAKSNISALDAIHRAETGACPTMPE